MNKVLKYGVVGALGVLGGVAVSKAIISTKIIVVIFLLFFGIHVYKCKSLTIKTPSHCDLFMYF